MATKRGDTAYHGDSPPAATSSNGPMAAGTAWSGIGANEDRGKENLSATPQNRAKEKIQDDIAAFNEQLTALDKSKVKLPGITRRPLKGIPVKKHRKSPETIRFRDF